MTMADRIVVMNLGVVEQVGTPVEIYRRPASPFVASFVGEMNFVPGRLAEAGRVRVGERLFAAETDGLAPGAAVTLCLRPEDVAVRGVKADAPNALTMRIEEMEFLGSFYRARLTAADERFALTADFSANAVQDLGLTSGRDIAVALPVERLRVFRAAG